MAMAVSPFREGMDRLGVTVSGLARELECSRATVHAAANGTRQLNERWRARALELGFTEAEIENRPDPDGDPLVLAAREVAAKSRKAKGLQPLVSDPLILDAVARILASALLECPSPRPRAAKAKRPRPKA